MNHTCVDTKRKWPLSCVFIKGVYMMMVIWDLFFEHGHLGISDFVFIYVFIF